ncbi:hypothetical protein [Bartonella sp. HY406]|uniref:hypothetical protein n=1 Tax=Bartonella sp. HY406 TaxID=2979331 RepID=UPI0021C9701F|nr:hypothetical protein [Bartonella sp. HY406]UXN03592.1 hypothetical protein N6B01_00625 [Bartonella sp. HY406]
MIDPLKNQKTTYDFLISCMLYTLIDMQINNCISSECAEDLIFLPKFISFIESRTDNKTILDILENGLLYTDFPIISGEEILHKNLMQDFLKVKNLLKKMLTENHKSLEGAKSSTIDFRHLIK